MDTTQSDQNVSDETPPASRLLSRRVLGADPATGEFRVAYQAHPEFTNRHGTVQGGFLVAMLDSATSLALLSVLSPGETAVTARIEAVFLNPSDQAR